MAKAVRNDRDMRSAVDDVNRWFDLTPMDIDGLSAMEGRILDAARRCYVRYGAAKISLNDVAEEAGVSRGSGGNRSGEGSLRSRRPNELGFAVTYEYRPRSPCRSAESRNKRCGRWASLRLLTWCCCWS